MSPGVSRCYELQPDPYDYTQRRAIRICLFVDVENASELRGKLRTGEIDAALVRAELIIEPFLFLAAANKAVYQYAHNRMSTRSLAAELIYSLSPSRNISDSLNTFGVAENSRTILAAVYDDEKGSKMKKLAKQIKGRAVPLDYLKEISNFKLIRRAYKIYDPSITLDNIDEEILTRMITKECIS
ncbi:unnamed protein product, partial [Mesorhabditis belari]|uniref:EKC/KEOPS complex subunit TPRKB n=1 Tax=Mesorhabditis belari TaxID=2138241 RepID=A0AAF3FM30_9BILA